MALRISQLLLPRKASSFALLCRSSHIGSKDAERLLYFKRCTQDIHLSSASSYPDAKDIPLPTNVEDINAIETGRFSPQRARDITGDVIVTQNAPIKPGSKEDLSADNFLQSYDCTGTVSLNSAMQTNVPDPYTSKGKYPEYEYLNMPGGEWGRSDKYMAEDLQKSHYTNVKGNDVGAQAVSSLRANKGTYLNSPSQQAIGLNIQLRHLSTAGGTPSSDSESNKKLDKVAQLKKAVKDYGATVAVFHIGISLMSLGGFYLAVTSGVDLNGILSSANLSSEVAGEVGSFVIAYAIHKVFAPIRISITLFCTPFIVRYLRRIGILTKP